MEGSQDKKLEAVTETECGGKLLTVSLPLVCSATIFLQPKPTWARLAIPTAHGKFPHQFVMKKMPPQICL